MSAPLFLVAWLATRLFLLQDTRLRGYRQAWIGSIQVAAAFAVFGFTPTGILVAFGAAIALIFHEQVPENYRLQTRLAAVFVVPSLVFLLPASQSVFLSIWLEHTEHLKVEHVTWAIAGFLLVANETNLVIRTLFQAFDLVPRLTRDDKETTPAPIDRREYNAGRIIGILERWLMYTVLVASGDYTVIAIVIAAKGLARFQQMNQREFAEYVLIGTLGSTLLTVLIAKGVRLLVGL